jgi:RIO kinase 1
LEFAPDVTREIESQAPEETIGVPELDAFASIGLITRIHATLTSGKEGTVYCCRAHPSTRRKFLAAKVYREYAASDHMWSDTYFEGRERVLKAQVIRAISARTEYGKEVAKSLWVSAEYETLRMLYGAGADTPEPIALGERAILMEYIGNGAGPAPHLRGLNPTPEEAHRLYGQVLDNVACMLRNDVVHGDLSPYNILVWQGRAVIIDVPQAVDVRFNRSAFDLLRRDVTNVSAFFSAHGVRTDPDSVASELWDRYQRAAL